MALDVGSRLGHYDVTALIGEGGMGQVYQATDTKLKRQVALKILPEAFSADPERLARFQREAEVLASLNHPNIAAIHGLEEADDIRALVLELVEGPTLADRIKQGPIPLDEALPIAKQIAEALEAAHEAGVIHRDLKPANIKVKEDGTVKVLDFGLAKALDPNPEGDPSQSPTLTAAATQMGVIMGTAAYMSPEQARGSVADHRADIWSFGVVLCEMLTGHRLFEGATVSDTLAAVLRADPNWSTLPPGTPTAARRLLRRCLERERKERLQHIGDARAEIKEALSPPSKDASTESPIPRLPGWRGRLPWAAGILLALLTGLGVWSVTRPVPGQLTRFTILPPEGVQPGGIALSPDGRTIAFDGVGRGQWQVYTRSLNELESVPLRGAENSVLRGSASADGQWLLVADPRATPTAPMTLRRVPLAGGPAIPITDQPSSSAGWGPDDTIVQGDMGDGLWLVPASGGQATALTTLGEREMGHHHPRLLPTGRAVIFQMGAEADAGVSQVAVYDFDTGERRTLLTDATSPHYANSGHLVFWRADSLWAVPFDLDRLELSGDPVRVVDGVAVSRYGLNFASYAVGSDGTLAYVPQSDATGGRSLVWVDRYGQEEPIGMTLREYRNPQLSPDGRRLVVDGGGDLFLYDFETHIEQQFTFEPGVGYGSPIWSPDGSQIFFSSNRVGEGVGLNVKPADGSGQAERLYTSPLPKAPTSWADDGDTLIFGQFSGASTLAARGASDRR